MNLIINLITLIGLILILILASNYGSFLFAAIFGALMLSITGYLVWEISTSINSLIGWFPVVEWSWESMKGGWNDEANGIGGIFIILLTGLLISIFGESRFGQHLSEEWNED